MLSAERRTKSTIAAFVMLTLIFVLVLALFSWVLSDVKDSQASIEDLAKENHRLAQVNRLLIAENHARITEIQDSRITSCKQTYEGVREVFKPFFPPEPRPLQTQAQLEKFDKTIETLKKGCTKQVKPDKTDNKQ